MATVYKKTYTKPMPSQALPFMRKGMPYVRWTDSAGKTRTAQVVQGQEGSSRIVLMAGTYTAKYRDGSNILRETATGCKTKDGALVVLKELTSRAERVRIGVITSEEEATVQHSRTNYSEHLTAYFNHMNHVSFRHLRNIKLQLKKLAKDCNFRRLGDLDRRKMEAWLLERKNDGSSARTRNTYLAAINAFCNWCVRDGRLAKNPMVGVAKADERADKRRQRRALTEEELIRLLQVASERPLTDAMTIRRGKRRGELVAQVSPKRRETLQRLGRERALIYKTFVLTGLRRGELASIKVGDVDLESQPAYLSLHAEYEKNREGSELPLRADHATDLQKWLSDMLLSLQQQARECRDPIPTVVPGHLPLFNVPIGLIRILDLDLKAAGIPKRDERGRTIDVHSMRHTFGTHLSKGGVMPRVAQAALRHSHIDLTMSVYTDPKLLDVHGALDALPSLPLDDDNEDCFMRATGTEQDQQRALAPLLAPNSRNRTTSQSIDDNKPTQLAPVKHEADLHESTRKADPTAHESGDDKAGQEQRAMRLELTTFSLEEQLGFRYRNHGSPFLVVV